MAALEAYLADRAARTGQAEWRQLAAPLLATAAGGRLRQGHLWELVRRLAPAAGIGAWQELSPRSLRRSMGTAQARIDESQFWQPEPVSGDQCRVAQP
jgi:integrase/recombinase XerD